MARFIPFLRIKYETKLTPKQVLERIQDKVAYPEWGITISKMIDYRIMTGRVTGNEFEVSNSRYGLSHGRLNYLLIMKGSVKADKQSGITTIHITVQPPDGTILFYIIFSTLMILLARYTIKVGDVMPAVISILFVVMPYLSLLFKLHRSIVVYRRFIEEDILNL
ncbi:hypothetical protein A4D02_34595 [Niastella koreensis]|uniref:Uncharacterized protein n=2 Tax=Niastella koreensis TaxID=354356 RepID=G8TRR1_NIAKG|nr:hypothetical protein [Niastella koreensis]AEW02208.1 hypothetical protein Niako_5979 [Niastella koreensis GR20-10]OQP45082.1 hypothetical protein A4D02_34595 [Niastella koreensis]